MSWEKELISVYDKAAADNTKSIIPLFHIKAVIAFEIVIDEDGNFKTATVLPDHEKCAIPVTNASSTRTSNIAPHPFIDQIAYSAGDYCKYTGKDNQKKYTAYIEGLKEWIEAGAPEAVEILCKYIQKGALMHDLIESNVITVTDNKIAINTPKETNVNQKSKSKKVTCKNDDIAKCICRVRIQYNNEDKEPATWKDKDLQQAYIDYYALHTDAPTDLCYATGKRLPIAHNYAKGILSNPNSAKLISAGDDGGTYFGYRGLYFEKQNDIISISEECNSKIYSALLWLQENQCWHINSTNIMVWSSALNQVPKCAEDSESLFDDEEDNNDYYQSYPAYVNKLKAALLGTSKDLDCDNNKIMMMSLDNCTTGRISIAIYEEISQAKFFENVANWHTYSSWYVLSTKRDEKRKYIIGTYSVYDIVNFAMGMESSEGFVKCDNNKKALCKPYVYNLLQCITAGRPLPYNIFRAVINKANKPTSFKKNYNHTKAIHMACSLFRYKNWQEKGENISMTLDKDCTDRNYVFGRLLACYHYIEKRETGNNTTNAKKLWSKYVQAPYTTMEILHNKVMPYINSKQNLGYYDKIINEVITKLVPDNVVDEEIINKPLSPLYLIGYSLQMNDFYKKKNTNQQPETNEAH